MMINRVDTIQLSLIGLVIANDTGWCHIHDPHRGHLKQYSDYASIHAFHEIKVFVTKYNQYSIA